MFPYSEKSKKWREGNKTVIQQWRQQVENLRRISYEENWHYERMEMEIAMLLTSDLRIIWDFGLYYTNRTKKGSLR